MHDLTDALAAQRSAFTPDRLPAFSELVARRRREDRRRRVVLSGAVLLAVGAGWATLTPLLDRNDTVTGGVAAGAQANRPSEQRLRDAFDTTNAGVPFFGRVEVTPAGEYELAGRPRRQAEGVTGETSDRTTSVTWTVVSPALSDAEVLEMAGTVTGSKGREQGVPVTLEADQSGRVRSAAFRFGDGSFFAIRAWAGNGGTVTLTSGDGAAVTDDQIRGWESAMRRLL